MTRRPNPSHLSGAATSGPGKIAAVAFLALAVSFTATPAYGEQPDSKPRQAAFDFALDMSRPSLWTVDTVHLGTRQLQLGYDAKNDAATITPTWSAVDLNAKDPGESNVEHSKLHIYQMIDASDCSQSESSFEIRIPTEYVDEGKLEFVFSLQAGAAGDYLFSGRTFTMADFIDSTGQFKKLIVQASEFEDPSQKLRAIERINFIFHRNGSMVSAPIEIRRFSLALNMDKILPPAPDVKVKNPSNYYRFDYATQTDVDGLIPRISSEDMDIGRRLNETHSAILLIPKWKEAEVPAGHSGKVTLIQTLGGAHDFEKFKVQYAINIPAAYFTEDKMDIYLFVQAGEAGFGRWSGTERKLSSFANKAGQDVILTMTEADFLHHGKKRNQIEMVGLQLVRNGSTVTEPITLRSITVTLPEQQPSN
jgi:hypothetical protein